MKKSSKGSSLLLLLLLVCQGLLLGQAPEYMTAPFNAKYYSYVSEGRSFRLAKEYRASALAYDSAFQSANWRGRAADFYGAASSWALAGSGGA
jgi:hypothetical protein